MKVLILCAGKPDNWSGIELHGLTLAKALIGQGIDAFIACPGKGVVRSRVSTSGLPAKTLRLANSGDLLGMARLAAIMVLESIDVVVASFGRDYWPATIVAKLLGRKIVAIRHQANKLKPSTNRLLARQVDRVVAVSRDVRDVLVGCGVPEEKVEVVHSGVSLDGFDMEGVDRNAAREELGLGKEDFAVGTAGRLKPEKGVFELLEAVGLLALAYPGLKLVYVGDGPQREALEERARRLSLKERVVFTGFRSDMDRMYAALDVFVLPSTCREAFGLVLIEAMAMRRPVIATRLGGIPEIVRDGFNGLLITEKDARSLAAALERYVKDRPFADEMAAKGKETVDACFTLDRMGENFVKVLKKL